MIKNSVDGFPIMNMQRLASVEGGQKMNLRCLCVSVGGVSMTCVLREGRN